jgi:hypothetical protein
MWACVFRCLGRVPWWVWIVLTIAGAVIGLVSAIVAALTAGVSLTITAALLSIGGSILSAYAATILNCVRECG